MENNVKETDRDKERERVFKAFGIAKNNSYIRCLFGDAQLFFVFLEGMRFQKTGEFPEYLLDNEEFLNNPEKFRK
jgi:hypothetical protein